MRPQLESIKLTVDDHTVAGIRQRDPHAADLPKLLCLHGWLDNANSFLPMMPYLPAFDMVAIDLPGHGHSDPWVQGYSIHELCYQVTRIIEALEWPQCHIVGHSLGGCIAPMLAVANPAIVQSLSLIEASGPLSETAEQLPARMAKAMQDRLNPSRVASRVYPNKQAAVDARLKAARMTPVSARLIIDRQLLPVEEGFRWRFDPRWRMASSQYQTEEQVQAIMQAVSCPALTVIADDGFLAQRPQTEARLSCLKNRQSATLTGNHHLHMDTPEPVAAAINYFLGTVPALGG